VLSVVLWAKTWVNVLRLPECLCKQDDKEMLSTFHELCVPQLLQGQYSCRFFTAYSNGLTLDSWLTGMLLRH